MSDEQHARRIDHDPSDVEVPHRQPGHLSGRALVTNDDGIDSPGLLCLARAVRRAGLAPLVVAPDRNVSGAGTGIGQLDVHEGVAFRTVEREGMDAHALAGPPGLAVLSAALGAFGDAPDLVVSGINAGANTGHSVIHSGTVGAALTGRTFGCSGLAVSLAPPRDDEPGRWDTAEEVAGEMCRWIIRLGRDDVVLNVNVPSVPTAAIRGFRWTELEAFGHIRVASADHAGRRVEFGVHGDVEDRSPTSDHRLLADGWVTVTALTTVAQAQPLGPDLPAFVTH